MNCENDRRLDAIAVREADKDNRAKKQADDLWELAKFLGRTQLNPPQCVVKRGE